MLMRRQATRNWCAGRAFIQRNRRYIYTAKWQLYRAPKEGDALTWIPTRSGMESPAEDPSETALTNAAVFLVRQQKRVPILHSCISAVHAWPVGITLKDQERVNAENLYLWGEECLTTMLRYGFFLDKRTISKLEVTVRKTPAGNSVPLSQTLPRRFFPAAT